MDFTDAGRRAGKTIDWKTEKAAERIEIHAAVFFGTGGVQREFVSREWQILGLPYGNSKTKRFRLQGKKKKLRLQAFAEVK